jgi:hypothetical protein
VVGVRLGAAIVDDDDPDTRLDLLVKGRPDCPSQILGLAPGRNDDSEADRR